MKQNIILFGGTGLVGGATSDLFVKNRYEFLAPRSSEVDLTNLNSIKNYISKNKIDELNDISLVIIASLMPYRAAVHDDLETMMKNLQMVSNLSIAFENLNVTEIIYISTIDVYGKPINTITEESKVNPKSNYAISKLTSELLLNFFCIKKNISLLILRLSHILGKNDNSPKIVNSFINSAKNNGVINLNGGKETLRDFVLAEDVAKIIDIFLKTKTSEIYNVATGKSISFIQLADLVKSFFSDRKIEIKIEEKIDLSKVSNYNFDISKLQSKINYNFTSIEKYLKTYYLNN